MIRVTAHTEVIYILKENLIVKSDCEQIHQIFHSDFFQIYEVKSLFD